MVDLQDTLQEVGIAMESVMAEIRQKLKQASQHAGVIESLQAFAAAVDWKEPWLLALLGCELLVLAVAVIFRDNSYVSGIIFALCASVIYSGERLNTELAHHWKLFAKQPYFDDHGIFFGAVIASPLLLIMFIQLVNYLLCSSSLLIKLKRKELIQKARRSAAERKESEEPVPQAQKKAQ